MADKTNIGRIELRTTVEGFWVASYRMPGGDAYEIGRVRYTLVEKSEALREVFKELMIAAINSLVTEAGGKGVVWHEAKGDG